MSEINLRHHASIAAAIYAAAFALASAGNAQAQADSRRPAIVLTTSQHPGPGNNPQQPLPAVASAAAPVVIRPILNTRPPDTDHAGYGSSFASETPSEQTTHIVVGRSIFIDTRNRLARVYITNPDVLDSYTASPNQVVVTAKKAGASTLILWDESGEAKTYVVSSDLNVEILRDSMKDAFPNDPIKVQSNEGRIVLSGTVGSDVTADAAVKLAGVYSKEVSNSMLVNSARAKQVRLEVRMVEVDRSKLSTFGFNFFSAGGNNTASTSTGQYPSSMNVTPPTPGTPKVVTIGNPLNFSLYSSKLNIGATLQDLATMQVLQILAEPNIVALSGQKAEFLAGGEFPFPVVQASATGGTSISIQFRSYGVKLAFTPFVNPDGTIDLKVAPEVSALDYTNAVNISGYTIPALSTRRAETQVVLKTGQTFAISGLLDKRTTDQFSKTPGIASVPILGQLFRSKNGQHTDTELIVIVTPTIVDPLVPDPPPVAAAPKLPVPMLNRETFDKDLPGGAKK